MPLRQPQRVLSGEGHPSPPRAPRGMSAAERRAFRELWRRPEAALWDAGRDLDTVARLAVLRVDREHGRKASWLFREISALERRLLLTDDSLRRAGARLPLAGGADGNGSGNLEDVDGLPDDGGLELWLRPGDAVTTPDGLRVAVGSGIGLPAGEAWGFNAQPTTMETFRYARLQWISAYGGNAERERARLELLTRSRPRLSSRQRDRLLRG